MHPVASARILFTQLRPVRKPRDPGFPIFVSGLSAEKSL